MIQASTLPLGGLSAPPPCFWGADQKKDPKRRLLNEKPWVGVPRGVAVTPTCKASRPAAASQGCCCCSWATSAEANSQEQREENNLAPLRQLTKAGGRAAPSCRTHARQRGQSCVSPRPPWGQPLGGPAWRGSRQPDAPSALAAQSPGRPSSARA